MSQVDSVRDITVPSPSILLGKIKDEQSTIVLVYNTYLLLGVYQIDLTILVAELDKCLAVTPPSGLAQEPAGVPRY